MEKKEYTKTEQVRERWHRIYNKKKPMSLKDKTWLESSGRWIRIRDDSVLPQEWRYSTPKTDKRALEKFGDPFVTLFTQYKKGGQIEIFSGGDIKWGYERKWIINDAIMWDLDNLFNGRWNEDKLEKG